MSLATTWWSSSFLVAFTILAAGGAHAGNSRQPEPLVILSTTDTKGKTSPCGCHVPKGGFARQASYLDSTRATHSRVLLVDNGGFFPESDARRDLPSFMMGTMRSLGTEAVGIGERDLRFGLAFLKSEAQRSGLPLVCANLVDDDRKPIFPPSLIRNVGGVKVGVFALMPTTANLGPAQDSLGVLEPAEVAPRIVKELRARGADVIVLLSQLGKVDSEDLVTTVEGIDAVIPGHNIPVLQKGRLINKTVACYGGEQGQYVCKTVLQLSDKRRVTSGEADAVMMGPEIGEHPAVSKSVKTFEDAYNAKTKQQDAKEVKDATTSSAH